MIDMRKFRIVCLFICLAEGLIGAGCGGVSGGITEATAPVAAQPPTLSPPGVSDPAGGAAPSPRFPRVVSGGSADGSSASLRVRAQVGSPLTNTVAPASAGLNVTSGIQSSSRQ